MNLNCNWFLHKFYKVGLQFYFGDKMKLSTIFNWAIFLGILGFALFIWYSPGEKNVPQNTIECIALNSVLYVQLGCSHCETQKELFGESYKNLTVVDCWEERKNNPNKCIEAGIEATPTWIINGEKYRGVREVEEIQALTGC